MLGGANHAEPVMPDLSRLCLRACQSLWAIACVFYRDGRQALLERARARTELEVLAVEQKRMEIDFQRANHVIDLFQKAEKINDPKLREKIRATFSSCGRANATSDPDRHLAN